ncbi:MAG TPA: hypothetical protein VM597_24970 [Gemmataceae bacterium]|jgi:hypothetical protein|nr:hypothetical protein [Gemmataceae bacterium]
MHRRIASLGTIVLATVAHAAEVEWRPAPPLAGPTVQAAARIGAPQPMPLPGTLPDQIDGPRLAAPPVEQEVVILPPRPRFPVVPLVEAPPSARLLPPMPTATPTAVPAPPPMPAAVPVPAPPRSQAPYFARPPKPDRNRPGPAF